MKEFSLLIDGKLVPGADTMAVINPATETVVSNAPRANLDQLNAAVASAKAAFPAWSTQDIRERREKLLAIGKALEARCDEFATLLTAEQGKPLADAQGEVIGTAMMIQALASFDLPEVVLQEDDTGKYVEHRTPLGVVAAITPWNYPLSQIGIKVVPAMLAGNTVVAKPAPTTPLTSLLFGELCNEFLPAGVLNVITDQNDLGAELTSHPDIAKVSFTGSTGTGKKVMGSAADSLKRVTLELGGNDAAIVLDDLDPKTAAEKLFAGAMMNCGQVCLAIKRAYVPTSMYDAVCDELSKLADGAVVGDGTTAGVQIGPIQNKQQYERVLGLIESARSEGTIIAGGTTIDGPGYFIRPTIVRDIPEDARLVREEQFGPVLPVIPYDNLDDVIARANDTVYGLGGTVWSADNNRAAQVARRLHTGFVWVNSHMVINPTVTTGGAKQSGMGTELGLEGLKEFTQRHLIFVPK
jgi:acyl-CoA reductase-like NAD-dependent aldehyde dehydrogenase